MKQYQDPHFLTLIHASGAAMTNANHSNDASPMGDKLWKAGKAALAESAQSLGGVVGSAVFTATALTIAKMSSVSGPGAAFLVIPTVLATAGLVCFAAYKAACGFAKSMTGKKEVSEASMKAAAGSALLPATVGGASALWLVGSVVALGALANAVDSPSLLVSLPAAVAGLAAAASAAACVLGGSVGLAMGATMPTTVLKSATAGDISSKLGKRRQNSEKSSAPSLSPAGS